MQFKVLALALTLVSATAVLATPSPVPVDALDHTGATLQTNAIRDCNICVVCKNGSSCCGGCGRPGGCCGTGN